MIKFTRLEVDIMRFIVLFSKGPNWRDGVVIHNQPSIPEHAVYGQQNQDKIILAGPFADGSGGAVVIDVESEIEAKRFVENDPAVVSQVFNYQLFEWSTVFSKYEGSKFNFDQGYLDYKHKIQKELGII
ncbi:YciI family protein [Paenibacillus sp. TRM 82003]|nr:YciI family protein [Paenibacillus sp. TRM 82003]